VTESDPSIIQPRYKASVVNKANNSDSHTKTVLKRTVEIRSPQVSPAKKPKIVISPAKSKPTVDHQVLTNAAVNKLVDSPKSVSHIVKQEDPNVQIISYGNNDGRVPNTVVSAKNVSLLSNPLSSKFSSHPSSSNVTSSAQTVNNSSQNIIIVSGKGPGHAGSTVPISNPSNKNTVSLLRPSSKGNQLIPVNQVGSQLIAISDAQTMMPQNNRVLIHDNLTGSYSVAELSNTVQQTVSQSSNTMSQPMFIKFPQGTVNSQFMQPKLVLSEGNMINSMSNQSNDLGVTSGMGGDLSSMLDTTSHQMSMVNPVSSMANITNPNVLLTYQNTESQPMHNQDIPEDVVYTELSDGDDCTTQENVVFVNPESVFLNEQETKVNGMEVDNDCSQVMLSDKVEQIGVINSVDNNSMKVNAEITNEAVIESSSVNVDQLESVDDLSGIQDNDLNNMAAGEPDNTFEHMVPGSIMQSVSNDVEDKTTNSQLESVQIPGSSIFQTEDGVILIQNPDGTTLQLQGPDGQAVSLETVQALLGMDGETEFVTEVNQ